MIGIILDREAETKIQCMHKLPQVELDPSHRMVVWDLEHMVPVWKHTVGKRRLEKEAARNFQMRMDISESVKYVLEYSLTRSVRGRGFLTGFQESYKIQHLNVQY